MDQGRSGRYDLRRLRLAAQRAVRQIPEQSTTPERGYFFCRSAVGRFIFLPPRCRFIFPVRQIALSPVHFPSTVDSPIAGSFFRCDRLPASGLSLPVRVVYLSRCGWPIFFDTVGGSHRCSRRPFCRLGPPYAVPIRHLYDGDPFNRIQPMNFSAGRPNDLLNL